MTASTISHTRFGSYSEARARFKDLLDAAALGRTATVDRDHQRAAIVDAERFRALLTSKVSGCVLVAEAGRWSAFIPGLPAAVDGATFDEAIDEMVMALREYAADWEDRLRLAPNHVQHWATVQLINLSSDAELANWLTAT